MLLDIDTNPLWLVGPGCGKTLHTVDSLDGLIEVKECAGLRWLHFQNGAVETVMSLEDPNRLVLDYIRAMMVVLIFNPKPKSLLNLGLGGGAIHRFFKKHLPDTKIVTIETDVNIVNICKDFFYANQFSDDIIICDAAQYLNEQTAMAGHGRFDTVIVDLFCKRGMAKCLTEPNFYPQLRAMVADNGIAIFNIITQNDSELQTIFKNIWDVFEGKALCFALEDCDNVLVLGFDSSATDRQLQTVYHNANEFGKKTNINFRSYIDRLVKCNGTKNGTIKFIAS